MNKCSVKIKTLNISLILFLSFILTIFFFLPCASAQSEEEMQILHMFFKEDELVVTPTRTLKPLSQVAENITVVTSDEIEEMSAHTLTDVLNTVTGVQMDIRGGPGSETVTFIHGSEFKHVLVMMDGVTLNNFSDNVTDIGAIPVQNIERIEIIKGPASSSWGSSLGGIINIITKSHEDSENTRGTLSASYGERDTGDYRAEASGKVDSLGYYIYAGNIVSDGLRPNTDFDENNLYTKLKWDINNKTDIILTFGYNKGSRGRGEDPEAELSFSNDFKYLFSTLSVDYLLTDEAGLTLSFRTLRKNAEFFLIELNTGNELITTYDDKGDGGSAKLTWNYDIHNMTFGADYDNGELELESNGITDELQRLEKWAFFANDTIGLSDKLSVTPGIRYDHTSTSDDFLSPSIGGTYSLDEKSVIRGYIARGFNTPSFSETFGTGPYFVSNPDLEVEKVWSYQAGVESIIFKYIRVKTTLFRHDISDAIAYEPLPGGRFTAVNKKKQRRQGVELEIKTIPIYNTSLSAGYAFVDAKDRDIDEILLNVPRYTYDIGMQYNDKKSFKAVLKGHYIWWNAESDLKGKYNSFIWDLYLTKRMYGNDKKRVHVFLSAHNIFDGSQYLIGAFKNPGRWIEGGTRLNF